MKLPTMTRQILSLITIVSAVLFSTAQAGAAPAIKIIDQNGRAVPNSAPSATSQIFDVTVGPNGNRTFSPTTVNIAVGDTVRWTWASNDHSVTSGSSCTADSQFCSPNDMNCGTGILSNTGAVYQHTFTQAGSYSYFCVAHCFNGMVGLITVASSCTSRPANMVLWLPGDGNVRDIQGGNNGMLQNGAAFAAGKVGQAFSFDGVDDQLVVPHRADQNTGNQITIDAWVNPSALSHGRTILQKRSTSNIGGYGLEPVAQPFGPDNGLQFYIMIGGTYRVAITSTSVLTLNTWQHVAATYDGAALKIYVDGVERASTSTSGAIDAVTDPIVIGRNVPFPSGNAWQGLIDEVEIFNRALSQSEIQAIVNAGSAGKCKPPQPTTAISRKSHGASGNFDIDLNPTGAAGIDCRNGTNYQIIAQFASPVTVSGATILSGTGSVGTLSVNGNTITANLTGVTNQQTIVLSLTNVSDGTTSGNVPIAMSLLNGDTNGDKFVNSGDSLQTRNRSGQVTDATNFRSDVNFDGFVNSGDTLVVRNRSGTFLP